LITQQKCTFFLAYKSMKIYEFHSKFWGFKQRVKDFGLGRGVSI
jgi:hypothetical protein